MNWAILENNIVKNIIVADETFVAAHYPDAVLVTEFCGIGWTYDGKKFIDTISVKIEAKPEPTEEIN